MQRHAQGTNALWREEHHQRRDLKCSLVMRLAQTGILRSNHIDRLRAVLPNLLLVDNTLSASDR